ncbi:MAG: nickel pincer cofactor biosynthesis protein LarC [Elainellaceae cyanobacterium]
MKTLAYLDCQAGIAGDMCLGALVDAGVPIDYLSEHLEQLGISNEYSLKVERVHRNGQIATQVHVELADQTGARSEIRQSHPTHSQPTRNSSTHSASKDQNDVHSHADHLNRHHSETHDSTTHDSTTHDSTTRHLPEIEHLIQSAHLPPRAEAWSLAVFRRLAEAEGSVHGLSPSDVHFHEVGATDAIVDIVGTCLGFDWLDIDHLYCSAFPTGGGTVRAAHGRLPVPVPAVLKLWELRQVPIYSNGIERELVTPTGAAIATTLAIAFGSPPAMRLNRVGLGAGSRQLPIPNLLRLWIGDEELPRDQSAHASSAQDAEGNHSEPWSSSHPERSPDANEVDFNSPTDISHRSLLETVSVLQTQIDDLNPQAIGYTFDRLFEAGALDVFTQAIGMKKSRPGVLLTVICKPEAIARCEDILFRETTTLGIRHCQQERTALYRDIETVNTPHGSIRIKVARFTNEGNPVNVQPEYEDCAHLARHLQLPWREVHQMAIDCWHAQNKPTVN